MGFAKQFVGGVIAKFVGIKEAIAKREFNIARVLASTKLYFVDILVGFIHIILADIGHEKGLIKL